MCLRILSQLLGFLKIILLNTVFHEELSQVPQVHSLTGRFELVGFLAD